MIRTQKLAVKPRAFDEFFKKGLRLEVVTARLGIRPRGFQSSFVTRTQKVSAAPDATTQFVKEEKHTERLRLAPRYVTEILRFTGKLARVRLGIRTETQKSLYYRVKQRIGINPDHSHATFIDIIERQVLRLKPDAELGITTIATATQRVGIMMKPRMAYFYNAINRLGIRTDATKAPRIRVREHIEKLQMKVLKKIEFNPIEVKERLGITYTTNIFFTITHNEKLRMTISAVKDKLREEEHTIRLRLFPKPIHEILKGRFSRVFLRIRPKAATDVEEDNTPLFRVSDRVRRVFRV